MLPQTATLEPRTGSSGTGTLYGDPVAVRVRIESKRRQIRDTEGNSILTDAVTPMRPDSGVAVGDRLTCMGRVYYVLKADEVRGISRVEYIDVSLGRA